jgi:hypothetical protein
MNRRTRLINVYAKANVALTITAITAVLVVAALVTAVSVDPPTLGWVGFAIVCMVVIALASAAMVLIPRMRVSPPRPAEVTDGAQRLLVVADAYCSELAICDAIQSRLDDDAAVVHLIVPVRVSRLHFIANDEAEERREAEETMLIALGLLQRRGIVASGSVGSDKPLQSMLDALATFPATDVLFVLPPAEESYWLERELVSKARALIERPITRATVASA